MKTKDLYVYVAGAVTVDDDDGRGDDVYGVRILPWRADIFGYKKHGALTRGYARDGRFIYGGPDLEASHGVLCDSTVPNCMRHISQTDMLFAWLDRTSPGTMTEIGAAAMRDIPIFVAFAYKRLAEKLYFARDLASLAIVTYDHKEAWAAFTKWVDDKKLCGDVVGPRRVVEQMQSGRIID